MNNDDFDEDFEDLEEQDGEIHVKFFYFKDIDGLQEDVILIVIKNDVKLYIKDPNILF